MIIQKAELCNLDDIMKIEVASFIPEIQEERSCFESRIKNCPGLFLVAKDENGQVFGYFASEFLPGIPDKAEDFSLGHLPACTSGGTILYISSLAILPEFRGHGTGHLLFNKCTDFILQNNPQISKIFLIVNEEWTGAQKVYTSAGFRTVTLFKGFFPPGRDAILMERTIS